MSSALAEIERFLDTAGFDRAPWLVVAFGLGIAAWFSLPTSWHWLALIATCLATAIAASLARWREKWPYLRTALIALPLLIAAGCLTIWTKSELVGAEPIERPMAGWITVRILERTERPAQDRVRLVAVTRLSDDGPARRVRFNVPMDMDQPGLVPGAIIRVRARLMPPAPPMLPGGYNFARTAWFAGLAATGTVIAPIEILEASRSGKRLSSLQASLSRHVRESLDGSSGAIAAALASGDRGGIAEEDDQAMRDSGLAHLLSISGLHVSALIGAAYIVAVRLLALWQWLALRVRLPLLGAAIGALAGVGYTLLTGAEVPTVRSCIGALLVLAALALGREALSLRILAVAALFVLLLWPESIVGPSFQMSFAAVMTLVAVNTAEPVRRFLAPREEGMLARTLRYLVLLLLTGVAIEVALIPIGFYHFHRAGVYGALANVIAIPLTTLATMPLIALALLLDLIGAGAPVWWLAGLSIDAILYLAHWISNRPGAVTLLPAMGAASYALFILGGLWLGLWRGWVRCLGLIPAIAGVFSLAAIRAPDILVSGDGRHVGITGEEPARLLVLRDGRSSYARENLTELAGMNGEVRLLPDWSGADCSRDFCMVSLTRGQRTWHLLISRSHDQVPERALAAACAKVDIVISDRWLPASCRPRRLKADRRLLTRTGGLAIDLAAGNVTSVSQTQGEHGWWRGRRETTRRP